MLLKSYSEINLIIILQSDCNILALKYLINEFELKNLKIVKETQYFIELKHIIVSWR